MKYCVVIPVFNSERIVGDTVEHTVAFFRGEGLAFEIILVNDGSTDRSWEIIRQKSKDHPEVVAINLLHNYGQHVANLCGFRHADGDYVITMDDDLQNPPKEIAKLIAKAAEGHDLVIGQFKEKQHSLIRRLGSRVVSLINRKVFHTPKRLAMTNFRIINKDVVQRVCRHRASYLYIPGLVILYSSNRANVVVDHQQRQIGSSNYNIWRIAKLVTEILFNYSSYPLRLVGGIGMIAAIVSFGLGAYYLGIAIFSGTSVPGWATVVVLFSFIGGIILLMLGMIGEYLIRLINQTSRAENFSIKEIVRE